MDDYQRYKLENVITVTKLVTVFYRDYEKDFVFHGEKHNFWELIYVDRGNVFITAGKKEMELQQGEVFFHKPNEFHTVRADGQNTANAFIISFVCHSPAMKYFRGRKIKMPDRMKNFISHIIAESRNTFAWQFFESNHTEMPPIKEDAPIGAPQMIRLYLEMLLISLLREDEGKSTPLPLFFSEQENIENDLVSEIIRLMDKYLYGNLSVKEICEQVNYGKTYVCSTFKNTTGYSIMKYYNMLKIAEAKKLIREDECNFTQISNRLCFDNPHYFTRVFKRITGMTPKEYQQSVTAFSMIS